MGGLPGMPYRYPACYRLYSHRQTATGLPRRGAYLPRLTPACLLPASPRCLLNACKHGILSGGGVTHSHLTLPVSTCLPKHYYFIVLQFA